MNEEAYQAPSMKYYRLDKIASGYRGNSTITNRVYHRGRMDLGLTDVTALSGAILGAAAFALSMANYLRDRPRLRVTLRFDMEGYGDAAIPAAGSLCR